MRGFASLVVLLGLWGCAQFYSGQSTHDASPALEGSDASKLAALFSPASCDYDGGCFESDRCAAVFAGKFQSVDSLDELISQLETNMRPKRDTPPVWVPHFGRWFELEEANCSLRIVLERVDEASIDDEFEQRLSSIHCRALNMGAVYKAFAFSYPIERHRLEFEYFPSDDFNFVDGAFFELGGMCERNLEKDLSALRTLTELINASSEDGPVDCKEADVAAVSSALNEYFSPKLTATITNRVCRNLDHPSDLSKSN